MYIYRNSDNGWFSSINADESVWQHMNIKCF